MTVPIYGVKDTEALEAAWRAVAEARKGRYGRQLRPDSYTSPIMQVPSGAIHAFVELIVTDIGLRTRGRIPVHSDRLTLGVSEEGWISSVFKALGVVQDVITGHRIFDARFMIRGHPTSRVREILDEPVPELLLSLPSVRVVIRPSGGSRGEPPMGMSFIEVTIPRAVDREEHLFAILDILDLLHRRVDPLSVDVPAEVQVLTEILMRPGGDLVFSRGQVRWDLDPPRVQAAERLGALGDPEAVQALIEVLQDEDDAVVLASVDALARLGNARCVPGLTRLLARRKDAAGGRSIADHAASALRSLGHSELVDAWEAVFLGDVTRLPGQVRDLRPQLIETLMAIADSFDLGARIEAARALGALGAREALPLLRDKTHSMGMKTKFAAAASEAVRTIEAQASLPRAASASAAGSDTPDTLPRPASAGDGVNDARLPRPADEGEPEG